MADDESEDVKLNLRLPKELHTALTQRAARNRRSLNSEMLTLLERFVDSPELALSKSDADLLVELLSKDIAANKPQHPYNPQKNGRALIGPSAKKAKEIMEKERSALPKAGNGEESEKK